MRSPTPADAPRADRSRGSVTAEFAAVIPAVLLVLVACLGSLQLAGTQLRLQDAASTASRFLARGETTANAGELLSRVVPGASFTVEVRGDLLCVDASATPRAGLGRLAGLTLRASGCSLDQGR